MEETNQQPIESIQIDDESDTTTTSEFSEPNTADEQSHKNRGRPQREFNADERAKVIRMASWGSPQTDIAASLDTDPKTLRKHCREELATAALEANDKVMASLFEMATQRHNVAAAIFWAKTRCGLRPGGIPYDTAPGIVAPTPPQPKRAAPTPKPPPAADQSQPEASTKPQGFSFEVYNNDGEPNFPY